MKRGTLLIFLLMVSAMATAQTRFTISGYIKDKKTGEALIGTTVRVKEPSKFGTVSNEYGFYSLTLPADRYVFEVSGIGYESYFDTLTLNRNVRLDISLSTSQQLLEEVVVTAKPKDDNVSSAQMGATQLNVQEINKLPVIFGERDILKTIQLLPSVKPASEGNSGYYVRGGSADQNLIQLDEAVVYNPTHLLGFFSTFNSDAIKDAALYTGNMPAQYGGRLSSVLDVKMKEGNNQDYKVSGGIGLISSRLSYEGPIVKDKGSFLISARRSYLDLFLKINPNRRDMDLYFYDLNLNANYQLGKKDRIYLSGYFGKDKMALSDEFGLSWGNSTATVRWNHEFTPRLFSNTSLIYSNYNYNVKLNSASQQGNLKSQIRDFNLKEELSWFPNPNNSVRLGFNSIAHTIMPGSYSGTSSMESQPYVNSWENAVYINNEWKTGERLNVNYGFRVSSFSVLGGDNNYYNLGTDGAITDTLNYAKGSFVKTYFVPEPRISASYRLAPTASLKFAYARNAQYLHLMSNSSASNPTDKWISTNNIIKPEIGDQFSVGYFRNFKDNKYELSIETYYKNLQNQIDYVDGANIVSNEAIEPQLLFGKGRAYGIELMIRKTSGPFTGWLSYTLSRSEKRIDGINSDSWYPTRQDRTHDISAVGVYQISNDWSISGAFVYYTGNAVTFPTGKYNVDDQLVFYYTGERNANRMPYYQRLDISATCKLKQHKRGTSELVFGVYNILGRRNPYTISFSQHPRLSSMTVATQTTLFRYVPSISYNFTF